MCWESVIKLLDCIWEMAVQLLVHTVYCVCRGENRISGFKRYVYCALYLIFIEVHRIFKFHGFLI